MYATLHNYKLTTPGYNGEQFIIHVAGPGIYQVRTCKRRGNVVEFGSGVVEVTKHDFDFSVMFGGWGLPIEDHKVEILTYLTY